MRIHKLHPAHIFISIALTITFFGCQKNIDEITVTPTPPINPDSTKNYDSLFTISSGSGQDSGQILVDFNTKTSGVLAILDQAGRVIKTKTVGLQIDNFQKWNINGKIRYTYFQTQGEFAIDSIPGTEEGYEIICDSNLNEIKRVGLLPYGNVDTLTSSKIDVHDFILLDDDHYIVETYRSEKPTNIPDTILHEPGIKVVACIIQEINNNQVIFQWHGTDHPEFYGASVENNHFTNLAATQDYMHLNSICIDPADNNLICSFRNLDEIIKINRTTGETMWRLGGNNSDFALTADENFLRQHYARINADDHTLMFLDNGDATLRAYSRILEFQLDENAKQITGFKAYKIPDQFIQYGGSVQKINDTYFIGGSSAKYALQINYNTNDVLLRLSLKTPSYRCLKYNVTN